MPKYKPYQEEYFIQVKEEGEPESSYTTLYPGFDELLTAKFSWVFRVNRDNRIYRIVDKNNNQVWPEYM